MRKVHFSDSTMEEKSEFRGHLGVLCLQIYQLFFTTERWILCLGQGRGVPGEEISLEKVCTPDSSKTTEELALNPEMLGIPPGWNL